ncbi:MAG: hypothetical protein AAF703_13460 [Cyanobacteria bacterium P01_D01_bin.105]
MSKKRNSVFSGVVPVLGASQTTAPIQLGAGAIARHSQNVGDLDPTVRYSTGSTLLDSFVQEAEYDAFALQTNLTALSLGPERLGPERLGPERLGPEQTSSAKVNATKVNSSVNSLSKPQAVSQAQPVVKPETQSTAKQSSAKQSSAKQSTAKQSTAKQSLVTPGAGKPGTAQPKRQPSAAALHSKDVIRARQRAIAQMRQNAQRQAQKRSQSSSNQLTQKPLQPNPTGIDGPRQSGPRQSGPRQSGPRQSGPRQSGPRQSDGQSGPNPQAQGRKRVSTAPMPSAKPTIGAAQALEAQPQAAKVYGGANYKAMQSRAQAGGLVNLEDSLLFGGTETAMAKSTQKVNSPALEPDLFGWLSKPLEDFTCSPIPGGWHPTAYLDNSEPANDAKYQTVLSIDSFKLTDIETAFSRQDDDEAKNWPADSQDLSDELLDLTDTQQGQYDWHNFGQTDFQGADSEGEHTALAILGKQVVYLHQQIEFLSKKLAAVTTGDGSVASQQQHRNFVVLNLDKVELSIKSPTEPRLATLDALDKAL